MSDAPDDSPLGAFSFAGDGPLDPRPIVQRLVDECEEFRDLKEGEAKFLIVFRHFAHVRGRKMILGTMGLPAFGGANARFAFWLLARACDGDLPDFILTLDAPWWAEATPKQREALVHHELCHCMIAEDREGEQRFDDAGRPIWALAPHDVEEFGSTVRRYGAWLPDLQRFAADLAAGDAQP